MAEATQEIRATIRTLPIDRAVPNGLDVNDYVELNREFERGGDYAGICDRIGDRWRRAAMAAREAGHGLSARGFLLNAVAAYRVGQYTIVEDDARKLGMYRKLVDCYGLAARYYDPVIERFEVPWKGSALCGWLRLPGRGLERPPLVISIGGADGWREEHHNYSDSYAERGLAYLMIDGPGQGESRLFNRVYMEIDNERALSAIVDYAAASGRFGKIGMIGYSFGGYLAARTAATCPRLDACAINGGSYSPKEILGALPHFSKVFGALSGLSGAALSEFIEGMTMEGYAERIGCPLMVNHGKPDPLFSAAGVARIYEEAGTADKTLRLWDDGNHCVTNHAAECLAMFADFFMDRLAP